MTALDTNVLARYILDDDPEQEAAARAVIEGGPCVVPVTVLLELAWVLRRPAGGDAARIVRQLRAVLGLASVHVEDPETVRAALDDAAAGMDLADAFHRAFAGPADRLVTFDRHFADVAAARPGLSVDLI